MDIATEFVTSFASGGMVEKADAGITIIGQHTTRMLTSAKSKEEMQVWRDALAAAVHTMARSLPADYHKVIVSSAYNDTVDLSDPIAIAYYLGQISMAEGMLADVLAHTVDDEFVPRYLKNGFMMRVLHYLYFEGKPKTDAEICEALAVDKLHIRNILDDAYNDGVLASVIAGKGIVNDLSPVGKQIVEIWLKDQQAHA